MKTKDGTKVRVNDRVEAAAHHLEKEIWNNKKNEKAEQKEKNGKEELEYNTDETA